MNDASDHCDAEWEDLWTGMCGDSTRGCYRTGATNVTLLDTAANRVVNTVALSSSHEATTTLIGAEPDDSATELDIPYRLGRRGPYQIRGRVGTPKLMRLKDYNGDGDALEFALFDAWSCSDLLTTLVGYSRRTDRVVQYVIRLSWSDGGETKLLTTRWMEHLFSQKPRRPGEWKYTATYPPGVYEDYEIRYVRDNEDFEGTCRVRSTPEAGE